MKRILFLALAVLAAAVFAADPAAELRNPAGRPLIAAHRGCWRLAPENSLSAIRAAIERGVDIVEIDVRPTKDGELVLMHDDSVDRTTDGKGKLRTLTAAQVGKLRLKQGQGGPNASFADEGVPTLREVFELGRGKIVFNLDKAWPVRDKAMKLARECGVAGQILMKGSASPAAVKEWLAAQPAPVLYMPILGRDTVGELDELLRDNPSIPAVELCWTEDGEVYTPEVTGKIRASGRRIWVNTLGENLCGARGDVVSLRNPAEGWGYLLETGGSIFQTDRPAELGEYLSRKGLR